MLLRYVPLLAAAIAALGMTPFAQAQHQGDVVLDVHDGKIVTGNIDNKGVPQFPSFIWIENLGSSGFPNFSADPGFDSFSGTFTPGTVVSVSIRKALRIWNAGETHFDEIPIETMDLARFSNVITTPLSDPACEDLPSLPLAAANSSGLIHVHPDYFLNPPHGNGVYLLELEVWASDQAVAASDPFWIIFNQNQSPQVVADAQAWVEAHLTGATCPGDLNSDGAIDVSDLLALLSAWGDNPGHQADFNDDCVVDVADLLILLGSWGPCS